MPTNETLEEIQDAPTKFKLTGIQEVVFDIDATILETKKALSMKRGIVDATNIIAARLHQERLPIQKMADEEKMAFEEAKARIDQTNKLVSIVQAIGEENKIDLNVIRGKIEGLEHAVKVSEQRFKNEHAKYERWRRIEEEEAEDDPLGRKAAEAAPESKKPTKPVARAKAKAKTARAPKKKTRAKKTGA